MTVLLFAPPIENQKNHTERVAKRLNLWLREKEIPTLPLLAKDASRRTIDRILSLHLGEPGLVFFMDEVDLAATAEPKGAIFDESNLRLLENKFLISFTNYPLRTLLRHALRRHGLAGALCMQQEEVLDREEVQIYYQALQLGTEKLLLEHMTIGEAHPIMMEFLSQQVSPERHKTLVEFEKNLLLLGNNEWRFNPYLTTTPHD